MNITSAQISQKVKTAGIIGAGGGGFPTYIKLQAQVDTVIANGSECEPLLASDFFMMQHRPEWLIAGIQLVMQATGAKNGVIALKEHYTSAIAALKKVLPSDDSIKLYLLADYYPAGDEFLLVYEVTGKIIPEGGIPLHVGVVVNNVITLMQVYQAVNGKPVTERAITLVGEFNEPKVVNVPIGTTYENLIGIAGGLRRQDVVLMDGGPMMGKIVYAWNKGVAKTTSGILVLPKDHFIVRIAEKSLSQMLKLSKAACCQCFRCTDLCPRNLIGHDLFPHMTMRTVDYNQAEPAKHVTSAFLCSQCGLCELIACDFMLLSPRKILLAYRLALTKRGVKNPHLRKKVTLDSQFVHRKIAGATLLKKLGLIQYVGELPYQSAVQRVKKVRIALNQHAGMPAVPHVEIGQRVKMCDIIASTPNNELGAVYHATISGKITAINEWVEITE